MYKRLTDNRFTGDGFYQVKSREERKEIMDMEKPSYKDIYNRLAEYENTGLSPDDCKNYKLFEDEAISRGFMFNDIIRIMENGAKKGV